MYKKYPKRKVFEITEFEGVYNFYFQLLVGDRVDAIQGVPGIGEVKAKKILEGLTTEKELFAAVFKAYGMYVSPEWSGNSSDSNLNALRLTRMLTENARLLHMSRTKPDDWRVPE